MDKQTLKDLEIFESEEGQKSIFDLFDHTITFEGSLVLKKKFTAFLNSRQQIIERQQSIRFAIEHLHELQKKISAFAIKSVQEYIHSTLIVLPAAKGFNNRWQAILFRYRFPDDYFFIQSSIQSLIQFLESFKELRAQPSSQSSVAAEFYELQKLSSGILELISKNRINTSGKILSITATLRLDRSLRSDYKGQLEQLLNKVYEMDALLALAIAAHKYHLNFPEINERTEDRSFQIQNLKHPFLPEGVGNDLLIEKGNFIFLTGPNMSGKTTFLKSLGVAMLLAHTGMAIPAQSGRLPLFDDIFTNINVTDSLLKKQSYFYAEVIRVKELAEKLQRGERVFSMFDELFRGTNMKDAYDCSRIVIERFLLWEVSFFVLSSHLTELTDNIKNETRVDFLYFESAVKDKKPAFTYRICKGISYERLGFLILENNNIPTLLLPDTLNKPHHS